jgi:hypothetical protein
MILDGDLRSEFLCTPALIRAVLPDDNQLALAIKAPVLQLRYLVKAESISLILIPLSGECLGYAIEILDDPSDPMYVWSAVETDNELAALRKIVGKASCGIYLFNEIAVNVAFTSIRFEHLPATIEPFSRHGPVRKPRYGEHDFSAEMDTGIARFRAQDTTVTALHARRNQPWDQVGLWYYSTGSGPSSLSAFDANEGAQQEALSLWIADACAIGGAHLNPNVAQSDSPEKKRELCDLLIAEGHHSFIIQSKALSIHIRANLPNRARLHAKTVKYVRAALRQASGSVRSLRQGHTVTDTAGKLIDIDRDQPMHLIVLIPDLSLLSAADDLGGRFLREQAISTGCFIHILDPTQLLRVTQAVTELAAQSTRWPKIAVLDAYLIERFERALTCDTPHFDFKLRFADDESKPRQ